MDNGTMLILRGIRNLLHEEPAKLYAESQGYVGEVLDASGETGAFSIQVKAALHRIAQGGITALYGFSGGGYNTVHIWDKLSADQRAQIQSVIVLGAPGVTEDQFQGATKVVIWNKPGVMHMDQPDAFLTEATLTS